MKKALLVSFVAILFCCSKLTAQTGGPAMTLHLLPAPKQAQQASGTFLVGANTRIVIGERHAAEDRLAAETLAEEIREQSGVQVTMETAGAASQEAGAIVLGRLEDHAVRMALEAKGVKVDEKLDDQGYGLVADATHIIVAGSTGQGLFYGVQTLRQLLQPDGKNLRCPAITLQDWPSMAWRGVHDDISRGSFCHQRRSDEFARTALDLEGVFFLH